MVSSPAVDGADRGCTNEVRRMDDPQNMHPDELRGAQDRLANLMTIMYIALQETLSNPLDMAPVHRKLRTPPPCCCRPGR